MFQSIADRFGKRKRKQRELNEAERKAVGTQILQAELDADKASRVYKSMAQTAIEKTRQAVRSGDQTGRSIGLNELKMYYGFYHYTRTLHDTFRTMRSRMQIQQMTGEFAQIVENLSKINMTDSKPVNFAKLTKKALGALDMAEVSGLDDMLEALTRGSISAAETKYSPSDAFFERLISGDATLDTPYPSEVLEDFDAAHPAGAPADGDGKDSKSSKDDDLMRLLTEMSNKL